MNNFIRYSSGISALLKALMAALKVFITVILLIFAATNFLWYVWWLGIALILIAVTIWTNARKVWLTCLIIAVVTLPFSFNKISSQMDYLGNVIRSDGPTALTTTERVSIYFGNISMALVGFAMLAPEVAVETLLLMEPSGKDRTFYSDFAMGSKHIRKLIDDYTAEVEAGTAPLKSERIPLRWPGYTSYSMFDYRVSLAVAGGGLFLEYKETSSGYAVDCKITIDVKYSNDYSLTVFDYGFVRLYIDEAIFTALQDIGWYHPFYAHYKWQLEVW